MNRSPMTKTRRAVMVLGKLQVKLQGENWGGCGVEAESTSSRVESGRDNWLNSPNSLARQNIFCGYSLMGIGIMRRSPVVRSLE